MNIINPKPQGNGRQIRNLKELEHDPYHSKRKLAEPTACPECGAIYQSGRWQWGRAEAGAYRHLCPACERIRDRCPAGILTLKGPFLAEHREEILHLLDRIEAEQKAAHPLKRRLGLHTQDDGSILATFTDPHLARAAGEAVYNAYKGQLDLNYQDGEYLLRVNWER